MKTAKQLERHFKGMANHKRIEILLLVAENSRALRWKESRRN